MTGREMFAPAGAVDAPATRPDGTLGGGALGGGALGGGARKLAEGGHARRRGVTVALAWAPAGLYMALTWALSSFAWLDVSTASFPFRDKGVHFVEYGVLALLLAHAARLTWPRHHPARTASLALLATVLWGFLDEVHQGFVPGRSSDALDLAADAAGAVVGVSFRYALAFFGPKTTAEESR